MHPKSQYLADRYPDLFRPEGYVFIITYGRSGSTLLQKVLNSVPGTCIRGENANVLGPLSQAAEAISDCVPLNGLRKANELTTPGHPWFGAERIEPDHWALTLADSFVRNILNPPPDVRLLGFKEVRNLDLNPQTRALLRFMRERFPNPRFIINTRNHDDTARSGWWKAQPEGQVKRVLARAETLFAHIADTYPSLTLRLHYDDYVADPAALKPMFDFLDRPFDRPGVERVLSERLDHTGVP